MRITIPHLMKLRAAGEKITMLSCYEASFAALCEAAGVEMFLVGDSLGMTVQGHDSTLPVSLDDMVYHTRCVVRGSSRTLVVGDLPFGSYQESPQQAFASAARLMAAGAGMVKLEGGAVMADTVAFLVALFKSRPSPFYVLDEVEAALDDVNLGRLIDMIDELRDSSQLIVITHQKRTMEIADALYGVSMRGDGVTQVIGQRIREAVSA